MSKIGQAVLKILTKRWFLRVKCRHYGKIRIFRKWPLGPFYDPPCPLTSCKKSEKSNEQILRKLRKAQFLVILSLFSAHLGQNGPNQIFFKDQASSLSSPYQSTPSCKKSRNKKTMMDPRNVLPKIKKFIGLHQYAKNKTIGWLFSEKMIKNFVFGILQHFHMHAQGVSDFSRINHLC